MGVCWIWGKIDVLWKKRVVRQVVEMYMCENQCNMFEGCAGHSKSGSGESDRGGFLQDSGSLVDDAVGKTVEVD